MAGGAAGPRGWRSVPNPRLEPPAPRSPALACGVPGREQWGRSLQPQLVSARGVRSGVPDLAKVAMVTRGPSKATRQRPPLPAETMRSGAKRGEGRGPSGGVGRASSVLWRSSPSCCTRPRPRADGRARETRYPRSVCPGVPRRFLPLTRSRQGFPRANTTPQTGRKGSKAPLPRCKD